MSTDSLDMNHGGASPSSWDPKLLLKQNHTFLGYSGKWQCFRWDKHDDLYPNNVYNLEDLTDRTKLEWVCSSLGRYFVKKQQSGGANAEGSSRKRSRPPKKLNMARFLPQHNVIRQGTVVASAVQCFNVW